MFISANISQKLALIPDALIFITLGMNLALDSGYDWITSFINFRVSWFIGVIIGILLSAALIKYINKRCFVLISSFLVSMSGILYILWQYAEIKVLRARYINGIGVGLIIVPFIVHCSETIVAKRRGYVLGMEQLSIAIGIFIQITSAKFWTGTTTSSSTLGAHGIFCSGFGLTALGLSTFVIESPISFLRQNTKTASVFTRLELPSELSDEKKQLLEEHKNYVLNNESFGLFRSFALGLGPLLRMILYRGILALIFSLPYNIYLKTSAYNMTHDYYKWIIISSTILRILGAFTGMTMADRFGRKIISLIGLLVTGFLLVGVAVLYLPSVYSEYLATNVLCALLFIMQFFAGLYSPTTTIYLSEAFPLLLKPFFISFCVCFEYSMDIVFISVVRYNLVGFHTFNLYSYALLFASFIIFLFTIPETKLTTLTEAQERFRAWMHLRSW